MGRLISEVRNNKPSGSPVKYTVNYSYFEDGSLKTLTYPSGDVLTYAVGGAGRTIQLSDSSNNYIGYSTTNYATYAPSGPLATMTQGYVSNPRFLGIVTSNFYNDRLQPILLSAEVGGSSIFSLCYDFHLGVALNGSQYIPPCPSLNAYPSGDNGNVWTVNNTVDSTRSVNYIYDPLNRIAQAYTVNTSSANCWGETYSPNASAPGVPPSTPGIDAWGNLTNRAGVSGMAQNCTTEGLSASANTQNQLSFQSYDAAGNVTNDGNGNTPTYDSENRIATDAGYTYSYDADGMRMEKASGSTGTMYWPGPSGEILTETDLTGTINEEYVYFNGERIARVDRPSGVVHYYFSDHLGTASVIADALGNPVECSYYYPYGGMQSSTGSDPNHYKFTGKERDSESGNDYFGARYYASTMGRFMTADPTRLSSFFDDPQTWNMYSYAHNNPLEYVDRNGKWPTSVHNQIIDLAFPNLSPEQRQILKDVSAHQDAILSGGQSNSSAFQHAMSSPGESEEHAEADYNTFVSMNEDAATNDQVNFWLAGGTGYSDKALAEFAAALHAVVDSTSPTHRGFQVWNWKNPLLVAKHVYGERESVFSGSVVDEAISAAQQAFNKTFHPYNYNEFDLLQLMNQQQQPQKPRQACVTAAGETTCENY